MILTHALIITGVMLGATLTKSTPSHITPPWTCCRKLALTNLKLIKPCSATIKHSFFFTQSSTKLNAATIFTTALSTFSVLLSTQKTRSILSMESFLDSISTPTKQSSALGEVHLFISQITTKEKPVYITTMKQISVAPISKYTAINCVPNPNAIIASALFHIIKSNKYITLAVTSLNFANPTPIKILDANIRNSAPSHIRKLKSKFK